MLQLNSDCLYSVWEVSGTLCEDFYAQAQHTLHLEEFIFFFNIRIELTHLILFKCPVLLLEPVLSLLYYSAVL